ncbi:transcriptional regulator with XRE-family HTH domain [Aminobacter aminovorans]|uniref:Anaerobic benzoate catabolism transcriptional regulator n=1 Tax=Aminobacter aminovorans TaxID=83263 RepID=A0A380WQ12_AMIAI|nr:helix-turn-helix transcriptional regulator [Aminobacter aminovorans]TCS30190.1 transcriptional regulator with XRE-family HTH domain [Aminobacter aminovorans]SUU91039.1 anaerobic benzoate catabolism transcriptional regulator [Aminobacter aminovorans]
MTTTKNSIGDLIREWRTRRRMSQLDLAMEAEISQRHLSFMESGRSAPSRDMVLHLAEQLEIPLRQRNQMLLAAGYAPSFSEKPLDHPSLAPAMEAVRMVLKGHEPYPAIAVDRHWNLIEGNAALGPMLAGVDAALLEPPVNVLRLSLHPKGVAPRIVNLHEWRSHLLERLKHQNDTAGDPVLKALEQELLTYPDGPRTGRPMQADPLAIAHPLRLRVGDDVLSFISTITVFGTPLDVTLSEIAIESFFPADEETAARLRCLTVQ